jgi:hydroxyethylthiazole kinase
VQNVTNYVVMNDTANATLQAGGSPVMAHENGEMTEHAQSVVLNIGTLDDYWLQQMKTIGQLANVIGVPVVLDPVGSGATHYRTGARRTLIRFTVASFAHSWHSLYRGCASAAERSAHQRTAR